MSRIQNALERKTPDGTAHELVTRIIDNTRCAYDASVKVEVVYTKDELVKSVQDIIDQRNHYKQMSDSLREENVKLKLERHQRGQSWKEQSF